jgi:pimeloyl-ACP methyl ester carboxylesterase
MNEAAQHGNSTPSTPVLLPGNMCNERLWSGDRQAIVTALQAAGLADPFHGRLAHDATIAAMAARALAETSGPLLPIGFSLGAIVAVDMWCQAPERITGLVLLGYNASADLPERAMLRPLQQREVRAGGLERVLIEELKPNYLAASHRTNAALLNLLRDMGLRLGVEVFVAQSEALRLRADRRPILPDIAVPVLLGCGAEDALCPPSWHAEWAERIPDATLFVLPETGHMLPLEAPTALAKELAQWLSTKDIA